MPFDPVDPKQSFPELEKGIMAFWKEEDVFKRSMKQRSAGDPFNFYDGPPFATGLPHYGHLLAGTIKDVIPRYQTMRGKYVQRRFGWDCHGLPVEYEIEKEQGINSKKDIEAMGVKAFNTLCRNAVLRYTNEWRKTVERMGRWVDMDWDYRTMDPEYMESIWWVFKSLYDKKLIYEGYKPMHICPRCVTPLSNFEVTQGYKDVVDQSVTVKFRMKESQESKEPEESKEPTFLLAWTTTPWTLPGNLFLAMHPDLEYVSFKFAGEGGGVIEKNNLHLREGETYIATEEFVRKLNAAAKPLILFKIIDKHKAKDILDKKYEPLFPYFAADYPDAFRVVEGDFVTTEDGTGIVHIAPGFGEDDFKTGEREGVALLQHVTPDGKFVKGVTDFAGDDVKPKDDPTLMDKKIIAHLKAQGSVFESKSYKHSYPHCWRCDSPLLNYATSSWFVNVEKIKNAMIKANTKTQWMPEHIRDGRFGKWLEGARDWAISRNRYWGTTLPIWRNENIGAMDVIGSRDDLFDRAKERFTKLSIVRHAESHGNVKAMYQGKVPGTDLTDKGKKQAAATAKAIAADMHPVKIVYCSPLNRTRQTAEAIAKATGARIVVDERLAEVEFGDYEGKSIDFTDLKFVKERRAHKISQNQVESIYHFDGMETWESVEKRCRNFLADILPKHRGEHIAIVTHADPVMNFIHIFTNIDKYKIMERPYPQTAERHMFFWDQDENAAMDLHKEYVDEIQWPAAKAPKDVSVAITVVRHGQTDWNKDDLCQGSEVDNPLNATGKKQAEEAAKKLKGKKYDAIVASDMLRAKQTAEILGKAVGISSIDVLPDLRERSIGEWAGRTNADLIVNNDFAFKDGEFGMYQGCPPQGESLGRFLERARNSRDYLIQTYPGKNVLVVTHGGMLAAMKMVLDGATYTDAASVAPKNLEMNTYTIHPLMKRIPDVLDCWFESGSMPYAQSHWPFDTTDRKLPPGFPADFIAEGLDQTRGWFYTLMVLSTALYDTPAFQHCVVNGTVLAEDGKKMSKRLKNYPDPNELMEKMGADAVRFALMQSPAVRGEDLRFSEKLVEEKLRNVLLPLWNSYSFFVTYANAAKWEAPRSFDLQNAKATTEMNRWMIAMTQQLVNDMTEEIDNYDLSATCDQLFDAIDALTNWYIRLNRRCFAGKEDGQEEAFDTLYRVLVTISQLLAPFCPFLTEAMYLNLVPSEHGSVHLTDWPMMRTLTKEEQKTITKMNDARTIVSLGLHLRSEAKIKTRQPLSALKYALPPSHDIGDLESIIKEEVNVKTIEHIDDPKDLAEPIVQIDARKVGPRLGAKVQQVIAAAKEGTFTEKNGKMMILGEEFSADEAKIVYRGKEGENIASDKGIVVGLDTAIDASLESEGIARDIIRTIQRLRKEAGLEFTDQIALSIEGMDIDAYRSMIEEETRSRFRENDGAPNAIDIGETTVTIRFTKI